MKGRLSWSTRTTSLLILKSKPRLLCRNYRDYGAKPIIVKKQRDEIGIELLPWGQEAAIAQEGLGSAVFSWYQHALRQSHKIALT